MPRGFKSLKRGWKFMWRTGVFIFHVLFIFDQSLNLEYKTKFPLLE